MPWRKGQEYFALEPSREHGLHVSSADLEAELRALIELADIVFVAATRASRNSRYVKFEISSAKELGVPVLPVQFSDQKAFPRDFIDLCGRNPVPTGLLRDRTMEALQEDRREVFKCGRAQMLYSHVTGA
jgi:hypothetical protein